MLEFNRKEMLDAKQSIEASELLRNLSSKELKDAFTEITKLEEKKAESRKQKDETSKNINKK